MGKKRIADSIIIRVGGGICEVPREPVLTTESHESIHHKSGFEKTEDIHSMGIEPEANTKIGPDKIMN